MKKAVIILLNLGVALALWVLLFKADHFVGSDDSVDLQGEMAVYLMLLGPWLLLILLFIKKINLLGILVAAALMFASELFAFYATFIASGSSTSALIYAVKPVCQIVLIIPTGLLAGKAITFWKNK